MSYKIIDVAIRACDSDWQSDFNQWKQLCKDALKIASKANAKISKTGDLKDKEFKQLESEWKKLIKHKLISLQNLVQNIKERLMQELLRVHMIKQEIAHHTMKI